MCLLNRLARPRALLPVAGLLFLVACASSTAPDADSAAASDTFRPVATNGQLMESIIIPNSDAIFEAAIYENGVLVTAPETLEEWAALEYAALAIAESGNLMLIPPRLVDADGWVMRSHEFTSSAMEVLSAARAQDVDELLVAGSVMYEACLNCHNQYVPPDMP